jgi:hypothetical protein
MRGWIVFLVLGVLLFAGCAANVSEPVETGAAGEQYLFPDISAPDAETPTPSAPEVSTPEVSTPEEALVEDRCEDSDGGFEIHEAGTATLYENGQEKWVKEDFCYDSDTLYEYFCEDGALTHDAIRCPCSYGVCEPVISFTECADSDGGNERYIQGEITIIKHYTDGTYTEETPVEDHCISDVELIEYFCKEDGSGWRKYIYTCLFCSDGVCSQ